jgi:cysteinyl-tRNA synthetase
MLGGLRLLGLYDFDRFAAEQHQREDRVSHASPRVEELIEARDLARKAKNFKEADRIRDKLAAMGIVLKDSKEGTTWEVAR